MSAPHPLAEALIGRLPARVEIRVLDFAAGIGRNSEALRRAGFTVVTVGDAAAAAFDRRLADQSEPFDAVISTHGFLHGRFAEIEHRLQAVATHLVDRGMLFATFGSSADARFGQGSRIDDFTFAPLDGDERGIAHTYFDRDGIGALLQRHFQVVSLDEQRVDQVAGGWAHAQQPLRGAVHWFTIARKR
jgi:hypothetical protein